MIIHRFHSYALDDHPPYLWNISGISLEYLWNISGIFIHMRWMIIHRFDSYALDDHPTHYAGITLELRWNYSYINDVLNDIFDMIERKYHLNLSP